MDEEQFRDIVDSSLDRSDDKKEQERILISKLEELPLNDILGFYYTTNILVWRVDELDSNFILKACNILKRGFSDDGYIYFRLWLISKGKETYYKAIDDPGYLSKVEPTLKYYEYEFEVFMYTAIKAYENKTGEDLFDYFRLIED